MTLLFFKEAAVEEGRVARGTRWLDTILSDVDFGDWEEDEGFQRRMADCIWRDSQNLLEQAYKLIATADTQIITHLVGIREAPETE